MDRSLIVLGPNDIFIKKMDFDSHSTLNHADCLKEYLKQQDIYLSEMENIGFYKLAILCINMGFILFQIDTDMTVCYLPATISTYQFNWYQEHKKYLKKFPKLSIVNLDEDATLALYDRTTLDGDNPFKKFRDLMEEKNISDLQKGENKHGK